ncbi:MAG: nicotinamide-nucleotide amidohydrolase family protein [Spirochaetia bacterium]|nr:nicotinamide-nucleotide amidohydrolase family protein [Spirochaetia bacterium]
MKISNARICVIGSEILNGFISDTNTRFFAEELFKLGITIKESRALRDNEDDVFQCLKEFIKTGDFIITCGGLGPTQDDLTVDVLCRLLNTKPVMDPIAERKVKAIFQKRYTNRPDIIEKALKQARIPQKAISLKNRVGLASGIWLPEIPLLSLPGFPIEIKSIWPFALKEIKNVSSQKPAVKIIPLWSIGESRFMSEIKVPDEIEAGVHALPLGIRLFIKSKKNTSEKALLKFEKEIKTKFAPFVVDDPLKAFVEFCQKNNKTFSTAESCTGGLMASKITANSGVSTVYKGGAVTYHNDLKQNIANVSENTLKKYGAVSAQTAAEMAMGILKKTNTDYAISATGIAGPSGGTKEKPVGTVFIGLAKKNEGVYVSKFNYPVGRERFREAVTASAFISLYQSLIFYKNTNDWLEKGFGGFVELKLS